MTQNAVSWLASTWSAVAWLGLGVALVGVARLRVPAGDVITGPPMRTWVLRGLALLGFAITWTFMILMTVQDIRRYPDVGAWLVGSNLFFDAYGAVSGTPGAWWLSSQLMAWAMAGVVFFQVEGARRGVASWCYLWLAMCVAVSVALPLFLVRVLVAPSRTDPVRERPGVPVVMLGSVALSSVAVVLTPLTEGTLFKLVMLALHAPVLLAAVLARNTQVRDERNLVPTVYLVAAVFAAGLYWVLTGQLLVAHGLGAPGVVVAALEGNPALASISSDLALTVVILAWWVGQERGPRAGLLFVLACLVGGVGAAFPLYLRWRGRNP